MSELPDEQVHVTLTIETARLTATAGDVKVEAKIAYQGSRLNGDRWQVSVADGDEHGPERRELRESVSGDFDEACRVATDRAVGMARLLREKHEADTALEALLAGGEVTT